MKDGMEFSVALNEFVVAAVCLTVMVCTVGYLYTHPTHPAPPAPVPTEACVAPAPQITIEQTYYVPTPTVNVVMPKPEYNGEDDGDEAAPDPAIQQQRSADPVFQHRTPVITQALQQPMPRGN